MQLTTKNIILSIISILCVFLFLPQYTFAYRVEHPAEAIRIVCRRDCKDDGRSLEILGVVGNLTGNARTKKFDMVRSDNGRNLAQIGANIPINTVLRYTTTSNKPAKGEWLFTGGAYDSPDMDGNWKPIKFTKNETYQQCTCSQYKCIERKKNGDCKKRSTTECKPDKLSCTTRKNSANKTAYLKVNPPSNNNPSITSTGAVSCDGNRCTATRVGDATITLNFPNATAKVRGYQGNPNTESDVADFNFRSVSFTYRLSVYQPNRPPVVSSCGASNVSYNNGRIIWKYTDPDGDAQRKAYVQVSTASNFSQFTYGVNRVINSNATTIDINGLIPGARYYFRVKANDGKVDSAWRNCGSFDTPRNNPPDLNKLSCSATSGATDYERARLTWNYTGIDEPGDQLVLKARYKRNPEDADWTALNLSNNSTGARNINDLISGFTYQVQISLNDNRNSHLGDRWKGCGTVTPPNYPVPQVTYSISKFGNPSTAKTNDQTLVLKTGDSVNANWSINNGTQVGLQSCVLSTTGGTSLPSSVPGQPGEQAFRNSLTGIGFSRNINNNKVPTIREDRTYNVNLNCTGKPAKIVRNVNQKINLKVESWPILISCIIDGNSTLQEGQTSINIKATVGNVNSYRWKIGKFGTDANPTIGGPSTNLNLSQTLDYKGVPFGRYIPWVEVARADNSSRTDKKNCTGTVNNLGTSTIREVN